MAVAQRFLGVGTVPNLTATNATGNLTGLGAGNAGPQWVSDTWRVVLIILAEIFIVCGMYLYQLRWLGVQKRRSKESAVMRLTEALSLDLLRRFLPTAKVEKYRFRGMRQKPAVSTISFENLCLELPSGQKILQDVSGEFRAGRLCAIMGPSGAGKTSLMNVLCGKAPQGYTSGVVRFNGREGTFDEYRSVMGFVPQEDVVHEGLTVGEQIRFAAELRNPIDTTAHHRKQITEDVLNVMQIDHIRNNIVGGMGNRGVSGGQRKRVSIGLELAADPAVLFLDEPTSGLDAASSLAIVQSLKRMAQLGTTSIMVIHQPRYSLFSLFDDVLLLGRTGRMVYFGSSLGAKPYFERLGFVMPDAENPADWFMDLIMGEVPNTLIPNFTPDMLYQLWEENKHKVERATRARDKAIMQLNEWQELIRKLEEEWPHMSYKGAPTTLDPRKEGVLRQDDLYQFVSRLGQENVKEEELRKAVKQLFIRIAGPSAMVATKMDVLEFLASLQGVVAADRGLRDPVRPIFRSDKSRKMSMTSITSSSQHSIASSMNEGTQALSRRGKQPSMIPEEDDHGENRQKYLEQEVERLRKELEKQRGESRQTTWTSRASRIFREDVFHRAPPAPALAVGSSGGDTPVRDAEDSDEEPQLEEVRPERSVNFNFLGGLFGSARTVEAPARKKVPREFKVILNKVEGSSTGAIVSQQDAQTLIVESVVNGLLQEWNEANPGCEVKKGYQIIAVNGIRGDSQALLEACVQETHLELTVRRRKKPPRVLHVKEGLKAPAVQSIPTGSDSTQLQDIPEGFEQDDDQEIPQEAPGPLSMLGHHGGPILSTKVLEASAHEVLEASAHEGHATLFGAGGFVDGQENAPMPPLLGPSFGLPLETAPEAVARAKVRLEKHKKRRRRHRGCSPKPSQDMAENFDNVGIGIGKFATICDEGTAELEMRPAGSSPANSGASDTGYTDASSPVAPRLEGLNQDQALEAGPRDHLKDLSPRTRAVWSKKLSGTENGVKRDPSQKRVAIQELREDDASSVTSASEADSRDSEADNRVSTIMASLPPVKSWHTIASTGLLYRLAQSRQNPGFFRQLLLLTHRSSICWWRGNFHRSLFMLIVFGATLVLALMDTYMNYQAEWQIQSILNLHTTNALLTSVFCLALFSTDRPVFWRERESGLSVAAFYVSKTLINLFDVMLQCLLLCSLYYLIRQPNVPFSYWLPPFILVSLVSAGIGYFISTVFPPRHGPFVAALMTFISGGLLGQPERILTMVTGDFLEVILDVLSYSRWSVGSYYLPILEAGDQRFWNNIGSADAQTAVADITAVYGTKPQLWSHQKNKIGAMSSEVSALLFLAAVWHLLGYFGLLLSRYRPTLHMPMKQRMKQRYYQFLNFFGPERKELIRQQVKRIRKRIEEVLC